MSNNIIFMLLMVLTQMQPKLSWWLAVNHSIKVELKAGSVATEIRYQRQQILQKNTWIRSYSILAGSCILFDMVCWKQIQK